MTLNRDLGDFQTPHDLVLQVLDSLGPIGSRWSRVLEPTCGRGHFLNALLDRPDPPRELFGIELQPDHLAAARLACLRPAGPRVILTEGDVFRVDLARDLPWNDDGPLLVVGNPPWVTAAELGALDSINQAPRRRVAGQRLGARTGASNFDLAEAIWIKLIAELAPLRPTIALLCKRSVARRVLLQIERNGNGPRIIEASMRSIDARRWFAASVDACLFRVDFGDSPEPFQVAIYQGLTAEAPIRRMAHDGDSLIADIGAWNRSKFAAAGLGLLEWRQGIKHDAAGVMELVRRDEGWVNGAGQAVDVEPEFVFPLFKSSDLFHGPDKGRPRRGLVLTQRALGDEIDSLGLAAPRLSGYLEANVDAFERRKSSIYRGRPRFALFGVGPYCFSDYKVAISGLHKTPRFRAIGPVDGRPAMFDDTCYHLPCTSPAQAALLTSLLNGPVVRDLLDALVFWDSKRPITKAVLSRIDPSALLLSADAKSLKCDVEAELVRLGVDPGLAPPDSWGGLLPVQASAPN